MTRRIYEFSTFSGVFLYRISLILSILLQCYVFLCASVRPSMSVCVIFCLFDFDEPALLLLHMLNVSLYYAITILILPQVSFIWLNKKFGTHVYPNELDKFETNIEREKRCQGCREEEHVKCAAFFSQTLFYCAFCSFFGLLLNVAFWPVQVDRIKEIILFL